MIDFADQITVFSVRVDVISEVFKRLGSRWSLEV